MLKKFQAVTANMETYVLAVILGERRGIWASITRTFLFLGMKLFNVAANIRRRLR
jgi:small basic protein